MSGGKKREVAENVKNPFSAAAFIQLMENLIKFHLKESLGTERNAEKGYPR